MGVQATLVADRGGHRFLVNVDGRQIETPPVEHLLFYVGLATLVSIGLIEPPVGVALAIGHVLLDVTSRPGLHAVGEALQEA